jgi:hypothetical protein
MRVGAWLLGVRRGTLPPLARAVLWGCLAVVAVAAVQSVKDVVRFPGEDLRPKVTGARALLAGLDPYRYEAGPATPESLQDYTRLYRDLTRVTYPPTLLLLYAPTSGLPYRTQRYLWAILEWAALLLAILVLARSGPRPLQRVTVAAIGCLLFAGSHFWRLHVERGQYYVFVVLLLAVAALACLRTRGRSWAAGILLGLAIALRPNLVAAAPVLWAAGLRRLAHTALATAAGTVLLTAHWSDVETWTSYLASARAYERVMLLDPGAIAALGRPARPQPIIEGYDYARVPMLEPSLTSNTALGPVAATWLLERGRPTALALLQALWPTVARLLAVLMVAGATAAVWWRARTGLPARTGLAIGVSVPLFLDYLLPIRYGYADLVYLVPLALLVPPLLAGRAPALLLGAMLSAFLVGMTPLLAARGTAATEVRSLLLGGGLLLALLGRARPRRRRGSPRAPGPEEDPLRVLERAEGPPA